MAFPIPSRLDPRGIRFRDAYEAEEAFHRLEYEYRRREEELVKELKRTAQLRIEPMYIGQADMRMLSETPKNPASPATPRSKLLLLL